MCKLDLATDLAYILSVSRTRSGIFEFRIKKEKKGRCLFLRMMWQ